MPSIYDLFVYLLEPVDLGGKSHAAKVAAVTVEDVYNPRKHAPEKCLVMTFEKARKHMKLNKTQAKAMMIITGTDDYSKWAGVTVILTAVPSPNGKETILISSNSPVPTYVDNPDDGHS